MISGKNYIANQLVASGTIRYKTFNPKENKETQYEFIEATKDEVDQALKLAREAFLVYKKTSGKIRANFLRSIAQEMTILKESILQVYQEESGLPLGRAKGEFQRTLLQIEQFVELVGDDNWNQSLIEDELPNRQPIPKPKLERKLIPIGPIAVFGASNFPLAYSTAGGDTISALASGCCVVVKSHPMHAATSELVAQAISKAVEKTNLPKGVFSHLNSSGIEVGTWLVEHDELKGVGFTGSIKGGRALFDLANSRRIPIPVFAEMGSVNPVVITQKALENRLEEIANLYAKAIPMGTGQFCTNPGLILIPETEKGNEFIQLFSNEIKETESKCMLHPNIKSHFESGKKSVLKHSSVQSIAKGKSSDEVNYSHTEIVKTTALNFIENPDLHHEVFGPFSIVITYKNLNEVEQVLHSLDGQLTGTLHVQNNELSHLESIISILEEKVGRIILNGVSNGVEVCEAMTHGGPYPASTDARFTAVGINSIYRWLRPITYQNFK